MNSNGEFNAINELDLASIRAKLMEQGWPLQKASAVELEYRRFLCIMKLFPDEQVAPLVDVDLFWHQHILDTMKYAADCEHIFGYFLHHSPDSGQRGEDEELVHQRTGARMQELYEGIFGEAYIRPEQGHPVTAASQQAVAQTAWCTPTAPKAAWCTPTAPKAAWCTPTAPKAAWCTPTTPKAAWCTPTTPKTAWCTPTTTRNPVLRGQTAIAVRTQAAAQNDCFYSERGLLALAA